MLQGRGLRHVLAGLQDGKGVLMLVPAFTAGTSWADTPVKRQGSCVATSKTSNRKPDHLLLTNGATEHCTSMSKGASIALHQDARCCKDQDHSSKALLRAATVLPPQSSV